MTGIENDAPRESCKDEAIKDPWSCPPRYIVCDPFLVDLIACSKRWLRVKRCVVLMQKSLGFSLQKQHVTAGRVNTEIKIDVLQGEIR